MKIRKKILFKLFVFLILVSIPFSYLNFGGFRVLPFFLIASYSLIFYSLKKIRFNYNLVSYLFLILIVSMMSIFSNSLNSLLSMVCFFLIAYWPLFIERINFSNYFFNKIINIYINIALLMGVGVLLQSYLYNEMSVSIGTINEYADRIGFGFIWMDYSFLSLYFTSLIPLLWYTKKNKGAFSVFFIVVSLVTTARTGFYALIIFTMILLIISFLKNVSINNKISILKLSFFSLFIMPVLFLLKYFFEINASSRILSLDPTGRIDGYISAIDFFKNNFLYGSMYDIEIYRNAVTIIPHNLFIYNLVLGGVVFFLFFIYWLITLILYCFPMRYEYVSYSVVICLIGFQFIPAVFTAYFFAFLISLVFYKSNLKKLSF